MKSRPTIMTGDSVRGILEGRKTQTRRVVKFPKKVCKAWGIESAADAYAVDGPDNSGEWDFLVAGDMGYVYIDCPYGQPGDRLWVRETYAPTTNVNQQEDWPGRPHIYCSDFPSDTKFCADAVIYRADGEWDWLDDDGGTAYCKDDITLRSMWKNPMFMPRWASRIELKVTGIRVERVQDISQEDVMAEGIDIKISSKGVPQGLRDFRYLWNSINEKRGFGWDLNPWVWVIEFERIAE